MSRGRRDVPPRIDERLATTLRLLDGVAARPSGTRIELFHRATQSVRVSSAVGEQSVVEGFEEGLAVRVWVASGGPRFAAVSGFDQAAVRRAIELAMRSTPSDPGADAAGSRADGGEAEIDEDPSYGPPRVDELRTWIEGAGRGAAWIEAASTVECLTSTAGVAAARSRSRVWSQCQPLRFLAARGLRLPRPDRAERPPSDPRVGIAPADRGLPWVVRPEPAALLVHALVRVLHGPRSAAVPVGRGWRVADDPGDPAALFGGRFDDAGFAASRIDLADGRRWLAGLVAPGRLRRASFRDPPVTAPCHLVVESGDDPEPADALVVTSLRIHPVGERWFLQLEGRLRRAGAVGEGFRDLFVATRPTALVRRCVAAVGPARPSYRGVMTPSLVFDGSEDATVG